MERLPSPSSTLLKMQQHSKFGFPVITFCREHMSKKLTVEQIMQMQKNLFNSTGNFEGLLTSKEIGSLISGNYDRQIVGRYVGKDGRVYRREKILLN